MTEIQKAKKLLRYRQEKARAWYYANKERAFALTRKWRKSNPERAKEISRDSFNKWAKKNPKTNRLRAKQGMMAKRMYYQLKGLANSK